MICLNSEDEANTHVAAILLTVHLRSVQRWVFGSVQVCIVAITREKKAIEERPLYPVSLGHMPVSRNKADLKTDAVISSFYDC